MIGNYYNAEKVGDSEEKSETLILQKNKRFEYILGKTYLIGDKDSGYFAKTYKVNGQGNYHVKNDSVFLIFKRHFDFKNYEKENLIVNTYESEKEKVELRIDFGSKENVEINVFSKNEKKYSGTSDFYGNIKLQLDKEDFPIVIKVGLASATNKIFGDYDLELTEINDYVIRFRFPHLIPVENDLSFPITRDENGIKIGKLKKVF